MVGEMPNRDGLREIGKRSVREIGKRAVRAEIAQRAIVLLDARGFDETTVEEIAAEVGVSPPTTATPRGYRRCALVCVNAALFAIA
jgi:hypothetical protein